MTNPFDDLVRRYPPDKYNLLLPRYIDGELPAGTKFSVREIRLTPTKGGDGYEEIYRAEGSLALNKVALDKIAAAAGISWVRVQRTDDESDPHYCTVVVRGRVTDLDGMPREVEDIRTYDLRDDGADAKKMKPGQLGRARTYITGHATSRAKNRVIANILAMKRSYSAAELALPFIVPKLVPDSRDPDVKRMMLANMMGGAAAIFGQAPAEPVTRTPSPSPVPESEDAQPVGGKLPEGSQDGAVGWTPAPSASDERSLGERLQGVWDSLRGTMSGDDFREWIQFNTGKGTRGELTPADIKVLEQAANDIVTGRAAS